MKSVRQFIYNRNAEHTNFLREYCGELEPDEKPVHLFKIKSDAEETKENDSVAQNTVAFETEESQSASDDGIEDADETVNDHGEMSSTEKRGHQDSAAEMNYTKVPLTKKIYMAKDHKETDSELKCNGKIIICTFSTLKLRNYTKLLNCTFFILLNNATLPTHSYCTLFQNCITSPLTTNSFDW